MGKDGDERNGTFQARVKFLGREQAFCNVGRRQQAVQNLAVGDNEGEKFFSRNVTKVVVRQASAWPWPKVFVVGMENDPPFAFFDERQFRSEFPKEPGDCYNARLSLLHICFRWDGLRRCNLGFWFSRGCLHCNGRANHFGEMDKVKHLVEGMSGLWLPMS